MFIFKINMDLDLKSNVKPYVPKKGEKYMSAKQKEHFTKILTDLKTKLGEDIDKTVHNMQEEITVFADPNDRASQESDMALELRNRDRERRLIRKIDSTLSKIKVMIMAIATIVELKLDLEGLRQDQLHLYASIAKH